MGDGYWQVRKASYYDWKGACYYSIILGSCVDLEYHTCGAEDENEDESEHMEGCIIRSPWTFRSTLRLLIIVFKPLQERCPYDLCGNIRPWIWS